MNVVHVIKSLNRGGAEMLLLEMQRASDSSMAVVVLQRGDTDVGRALEAQGARIIALNARGPGAVLATVSSVARSLRQLRADLVHAHLPLAGVVARVACRHTGIPVVYSEHNRFPSYHPLTQLASRATWDLQARVVAVSADVAESVPVSSVPVDVVRNGIATERFRHPGGAKRAACRSNLGLAPDDVVVSTVAVFRPAKRLDLWLEMAARVASKAPQTRFLVAGWGPLETALRSRAADLGLGERLRFLGALEDVRELLWASDVFVSSSDWEGLPVATIEAMASGLPIVATRVGGVPEAVDEAVGRLTTRGNVDELASAVLGLVGDGSARRRLGEAGRTRAAGSFGIARMQQELMLTYNKAMAKRG